MRLCDLLSEEQSQFSHNSAVTYYPDHYPITEGLISNGREARRDDMLLMLVQRRGAEALLPTSTHLREHGQFFGKVDDAGDGRSDDLGELAEGLQVHLVSV